jgi:hypothetical protein
VVQKKKKKKKKKENNNNNNNNQQRTERKGWKKKIEEGNEINLKKDKDGMAKTEYLKHEINKDVF